MDESTKVALRLITNTDLEFTIYQDEIKQGAFSTSATGLHLLFGKTWDKQAWSTILNSNRQYSSDLWVIWDYFLPSLKKIIFAKLFGIVPIKPDATAHYQISIR